MSVVMLTGRDQMDMFIVEMRRLCIWENTHEISDTSPSYNPLRTVYSPRDASCFGQLPLNSDYQHPKIYRNVGSFQSANIVKVSGLYNQKILGKRNGVNGLNSSLSQWPNQRQQSDGTDLDEFRLRDASVAAQHACNMARLKREKVQRLLYKASFEDLNYDDEDDSDDDELTEDDYLSDDDSSDSDRTR